VVAFPPQAGLVETATISLSFTFQLAIPGPSCSERTQSIIAAPESRKTRWMIFVHCRHLQLFPVSADDQWWWRRSVRRRLSPPLAHPYRMPEMALVFRPPVSLSFRGQLKRFINMRATIFTGVWDCVSSATIRCYCFPRLGGSPDRSS